MRAQVIGQRLALDPAEHRAFSERITASLKLGFAPLAGGRIAFCWPCKREFDARFAVRHFRDRGASAALPEVVASGRPLRFRKWWPGAPMARGIYDIPFPNGTEEVAPDAALVPMNAFDRAGFRLGYGGGYFDRTLAALAPRPIAIGIGFERFRLDTIHPQPHDIAMDFVVTEAGIHLVANAALQPIDAADCARAVEAMLCARGLRRAAEGEYSSPVCYAHEFPGYFGEDDAGKTER